MFSVKIKCRNCAKYIEYAWEQKGLEIKLIPHECECETLTNNDHGSTLDKLLISLKVDRLLTLTKNLLLKREYDGLCGRPWDAQKHQKHDEIVSEILRLEKDRIKILL